MRAALLLALLTGSVAAPAAAELVLQGARWQILSGEPRARAWADVKTLEDGPPKLDSRLRTMLVLKNRGPKPAEGVLVRYALSARIGPEGAEGSWSLPFVVESKRVPEVKANQVLEVPVHLGAGFTDYFQRLARAGWWPDRLRVQMMIEPRAGDQTVQAAEDVLELKR